MRPDFFDCGSIGAFVREEPEDEVFELRTQRMAVDFGPVCVVPAIKKQLVEVFLLSCLLEGKDALHDNEEDDGEGEKVDLRAHVCLPFFDLRGHVSHGASVRLQRVNVLVAREAKVTNL